MDLVLSLGEAAVVVALASFMKPSKKGLNGDEKEEGGECVPLYGAFLYADEVSGAFMCTDSGASPLVQVSHSLPHLLGDSHLVHGLSKSIMPDCVEGC